MKQKIIYREDQCLVNLDHIISVSLDVEGGRYSVCFNASTIVTSWIFESKEDRDKAYLRIIKEYATLII